MKRGRGSGAPPQPPTLFYYIMRTTLHNTALPFVCSQSCRCITNFSHLYFAIILNGPVARKAMNLISPLITRDVTAGGRMSFLKNFVRGGTES